MLELSYRKMQDIPICLLHAVSQVGLDYKSLSMGPSIRPSGVRHQVLSAVGVETVLPLSKNLENLTFCSAVWTDLSLTGKPRFAQEQISGFSFYSKRLNWFYKGAVKQH